MSFPRSLDRARWCTPDILAQDAANDSVPGLVQGNAPIVDRRADRLGVVNTHAAVSGARRIDGNRCAPRRAVRNARLLKYIGVVRMLSYGCQPPRLENTPKDRRGPYWS